MQEQRIIPSSVETIKLKSFSGDKIDRATKYALNLAEKYDCTVEFTFNGIDMQIDKSDNKEDLLDFYYQELLEEGKLMSPNNHPLLNETKKGKAVSKYLSSKEIKSCLVDNYLKEIQNYFEEKEQEYEAFVTLEKHIFPDFVIVLIILETEINSLSHEINMIEEIGEKLDEARDKFLEERDENPIDETLNITYTLEPTDVLLSLKEEGS